MKTFKEYFTEEMTKRKKKEKLPLVLTISKGHEFGMVGAGKSGLMQADRKDFKRKKQRKEGKEQERKALRGDY